MDKRLDTVEDTLQTVKNSQIRVELEQFPRIAAALDGHKLNSEKLDDIKKNLEEITRQFKRWIFFIKQDMQNNHHSGLLSRVARFSFALNGDPTREKLGFITFSPARFGKGEVKIRKTGKSCYANSRVDSRRFRVRGVTLRS